jgi:membrane protein DedA with SNARE-associated domain
LPFASLTSTITDLLTHHGVLAVALLMAIDALFPVGGELVMLLAGALAAGAIGSGISGVGTGAGAYLLLSIVGTFGYLAGSVIGWLIGRNGGRELIARRGRWLHLGPERMERAEAWFAAHGRAAVFLGRLTPVVRSFISIPAGVLDAPLGPYVVLTAAGSAIWCFAFAAAGWALGANWHSLHDAFSYVDIVAVLVVLAGAVWLLARRRSRTS